MTPEQAAVLVVNLALIGLGVGVLVLVRRVGKKRIRSRGTAAAVGPSLLVLGTFFLPLTHNLYVLTETAFGLGVLENMLLWYGVAFVLVLAGILVLHHAKK